MSKPKQKQKARRMLVQALYSWDVGGTDLVNIEAEFHSDNDMNKVDVTLFHNILYGVPKNLAEIDGTYEPFLDRENKQLDPVSRAVLRLSSYEMLYTIDVPYKVVINEGVNLAKPMAPPMPINSSTVFWTRLLLKSVPSKLLPTGAPSR